MTLEFHPELKMLKFILIVMIKTAQVKQKLQMEHH